MNDWDQKGALPHERSSDAGWRKFTQRQVFALLVAVEIRRQFGVPVDRLKWITGVMLADGDNYLRRAAELISILGVNLWIVTDLEKTFIMDSDLELSDMFGMGAFGNSRGLIFLRVNPLVDRFVGEDEDGEPLLPLHGRGYEWAAAIVRGMKLTRSEEHVVSLVRSGEYKSIEVMLGDGEIKRIKRSRHQDVAAKVQDLIRSEDFQSIRINVRDGQVVSLEQEVVEKP